MLANPPSAYGRTHHRPTPSASTSTSTSASSSSGSPYTPPTTHLFLLSPPTAASSAIPVPGSDRKPHPYAGSASYVIHPHLPAAGANVRVIVDEDENDDAGAESDVSMGVTGLTGMYGQAQTRATKRRVRRTRPEKTNTREEQERAFRRTSALHDRPLSFLSTTASPVLAPARLPSPSYAPSLSLSPSRSPPPQLLQDIETSPLRAASALLPFLGSGSEDSHVSSGSRHSRHSRRRSFQNSIHGNDDEEEIRRYGGYDDECNYDPEGRYSPLEQSAYAYARADAEAAAMAASRRRSTGSGSVNGYGSNCGSNYGYGHGNASYIREGNRSKPVIVDLSHDSSGPGYDSYGREGYAFGYENENENRYSNSYDADGEGGFVPVPVAGLGRGRSASDSTAHTSDSGHPLASPLQGGRTRTRRRFGLEGEALQRVLEQRRAEWVVATPMPTNGIGAGSVDVVGTAGVTSRFFDDDDDAVADAGVLREKRARRTPDDVDDSQDGARGCFSFLRPGSGSSNLPSEKDSDTRHAVGRWTFPPMSLSLPTSLSRRTKVGRTNKAVSLDEKTRANAVGLDNDDNTGVAAPTYTDGTFLNIFDSNASIRAHAYEYTNPDAEIGIDAPSTAAVQHTYPTQNQSWYWRVRARWTAVKLRVRLGAFRARRRAGLV